MKSILFLSVILFGACVDVVDDNAAEDSTDVPRLSSNGLSPATLLATTLDGAALTGAAVTAINNQPNGGSFLNYLIGCALDPTQSITVGANTYPGVHGLAPSWTTGPLTLSERRWVSACLLARTNYSGANVTISLRGTSAVLSLVGTEGATTYLKQEGAFYGDLFGGNNIRRACAGADLLANPLATAFKSRKCALSDDATPSITMCGFGYDGDCASHCTVSGDGYSSCTDVAAGTWAETIKVNLN